MGLATRIIPTLLCRGRQLVKGKQFNAWRSVGLVTQAVRIHQSRGVDELVLLDIAATTEGRGPDLSLIEELTENCFMPLTVGGGVRSVDDVKALLRAGADKVVIGTAALERPALVKEITDIVGSQAIVVAIDHTIRGVVLRGRVLLTPGIEQAAMHLTAMGAGEILLTSVAREGMMTGYCLDTISALREAVSVPVISHGGCGEYAHMLEAIKAGASAVAAGSLFQFTDATPRGAAEYLAQHGIETRIPA